MKTLTFIAMLAATVPTLKRLTADLGDLIAALGPPGEGPCHGRSVPPDAKIASCGIACSIRS